MTSRRDFLATSALSAVGASAFARGAAGTPAPRHAPAHGFIDLLRAPDLVAVETDAAERKLDRANEERWTYDDITVTTAIAAAALSVSLSAPRSAVKRVHLRWRGDLSPVHQLLGDAWERSYGDLEWRGWVADRVMPWYAATYDGTNTHCYGVRTGARAFCFWQIDPRGISLWADVRSGGVALQLGDRTLDALEIVCRQGHGGETSFAALHAFCAQMCRNPRLPAHPVYGHNDWYWAYGKNSADSVLADTQHIVELSPPGENRPFAVIDDGWQPARGQARSGVGTWDRGNEKFPDMPGLAASIKHAGARPGIWIRPLQAPADAPEAWRLSRDRAFLDPSMPEARQKIAGDIARLARWGFELVKHDYTTYDIFGRWGFQMGAAMTREGWTFASGPSRTTAEIINDLYTTIRGAAGDNLLIGCNTVSHLSAGQFEICRVGDDTSGTEWPRTRKMGVNTLAFRGVQHGAFYVADPDCVGVTSAIPWSLNRQWLDLLARSGTMLFVSLDPAALGVDQKGDLTSALSLAAQAKPLGEPLDWQRAAYPSRWRLMSRERIYDWIGPDGPGLP